MRRLLLLVLLSVGLGACATTDKMTVSGTPDTAPSKYRNALAVRSVTGECNVSHGGIKPLICEAPVSAKNIKEGLEKSLAANGYLTTETTAPKYYVDVEVQEIRTPLLALDMEITTTVNYKISGEGTVKTYPITSVGKTPFVEMPVGAIRAQYAVSYSLKQNFSQLLQQLHDEQRP